jgi:hypothetical protein
MFFPLFTETENIYAMATSIKLSKFTGEMSHMNSCSSIYMGRILVRQQ